MKNVIVLILLVATSAAAQTVGFGPENVVVEAYHHLTFATTSEFKVPSFAAAGRDGNYLLAWTPHDLTTNRPQLSVAKIDATGRIVSGTRRLVPALRTENPDAQFPAVAFDGERFLVAWLEGTGTLLRLVAMRFDRDGVPLDAVPQPVTFELSRTNIAAAAGGGAFWITYGSGSRVAVARIAADGSVIERDRFINTTPGYWRDIETNGTSVLLVSEAAGQQNCIIGFCVSFNARGFASLASPGATWQAKPIENPGGAPGVGTGLGSDGTRYLAVSKVPNVAISQWGWLMRGRLLDATGANVLREFVIAKHDETNVSEPPGGRIDAVWTGSTYAVAYELRTPRDLNLRLTFVSPTGMALVDPAELASSDREERHPVILPLGDGRVLVLYERGVWSRPEIMSRVASLSFRSRAVR